MLRLKDTVCIAALVAGVFAAGAANAQEFKPKSAGDILVRLRGIAVTPDEHGAWTLPNGSVLSTSNTKLGTSQVPEADFTYFITDNFAVEAIAGVTRHDVKVTLGGNEVANAGHIWLLPPTITLQYHPFPKAQFSPYAGVGINYTFFFNAGGWDPSSGLRVAKVKYEDNVGAAFQAGFDYAISGSWSLNLDVKKLILSTKATATLVGGTVVKSNVDINPWIVGLGVGYRF